MVIVVGTVSFEQRKPGDKLAAPWRCAPSPQQHRVKAKLKAKAAPVSKGAAATDAGGSCAPPEAGPAPGRRRRRRAGKARVKAEPASPLLLQQAPTEFLQESFEAYMAEVAKARVKAEPASPYAAGRHLSPEAISP